MSDGTNGPAGDTPMTLDPAEGGKARWKGTTKQQRSEAARKAAEARWQAGLPRATHGSDDHPMRIGEIEIPCYVLDNGMRVITHRGLQGAVGMTVRGGATETATFVGRLGLKGLDCNPLIARLSSPVEFVPIIGGRTAFGYEATVLADFCDLFLEARRIGDILNATGERIAARCELLARGFARVGIIALVDEATGYQRDRARDALAKILEAFIAKELRPWVRTFDPTFYEELFRIRGLTYPGTLKGHRYIGHLTNDIVYSRLAPGVLAELKAKNPVRESGGRRAKHHQWLTPNHGHPKLREHIAFLIGLMSACEDNSWDTFYKMLSRSKPKQVACPLFDGLEDDAGMPLCGDESGPPDSE
jgi:hypothetical protein